MVAHYGKNRIDGLHGVGWTLMIYIPPVFTARRIDCIAILSHCCDSVDARYMRLSMCIGRHLGLRVILWL